MVFGRVWIIRYIKDFKFVYILLSISIVCLSQCNERDYNKKLLISMDTVFIAMKANDTITKGYIPDERPFTIKFTITNKNDKVVLFNVNHLNYFYDVKNGIYKDTFRLSSNRKFFILYKVENHLDSLEIVKRQGIPILKIGPSQTRKVHYEVSINDLKNSYNFTRYKNYRFYIESILKNSKIIYLDDDKNMFEIEMKDYKINYL